MNGRAIHEKLACKKIRDYMAVYQQHEALGDVVEANMGLMATACDPLPMLTLAERTF